MKLESTDDFGGKRVVSEGKLLEVMPIITDAAGQPMMLPPIVYRVPNWFIGYKDDHTISMPYQIYLQERATIPGSVSSAPHQISFLVRIMEDDPSSTPQVVASVDTEAVVGLIEAIRHSINVYRAR
jgi:hypothetical protein